MKIITDHPSHHHLHHLHHHYLAFMGSGRGSHSGLSSGSSSSSSAGSPPPLQIDTKNNEKEEEEEEEEEEDEAADGDFETANSLNRSQTLSGTHPQVMSVAHSQSSITGPPSQSSSPASHASQSAIPESPLLSSGSLGATLQSSSHMGPLSQTSSHGMGPSSQSSSPVGFFNHRNLVQDEKLAAAALASLENSADPSNIIKQDLRLVIQSRRKAEGKGELFVDFNSPPKDEQLSSEELEKRARRRELNRLAAKRSRDKCQRRKDTLLQAINRLQTDNGALKGDRDTLTKERERLCHFLRSHLVCCKDIQAMSRSSKLMTLRMVQLLGLTQPNPSASDTIHSSLCGDQGLSVGVQIPPPAQPPLASPRPNVREVQMMSPLSVAKLPHQGVTATCSKSDESPHHPAWDHPSPSAAGLQQPQAAGVRGHGREAGRAEPFAGRKLEIDAAAAAALRSEIERHHHRLQSRASAPPSPTSLSHTSQAPYRVKQKHSHTFPRSSSPPHPASQPATPTYPHPSTTSAFLAASEQTVADSPFTWQPLSSPKLLQHSHMHLNKTGNVTGLSESSRHPLSSAACLSDRAHVSQDRKPLLPTTTPQVGHTDSQAVIQRPQSLKLRTGGVNPKKDPALYSPIPQRKTLPVTVQKEPSVHCPPIPKKDPALRSSVLPKKDLSLRSSVFPMRSPTIPKKDPALRLLGVELSASSSTVTPSPSPGVGESGQFKRGPMLCMPSFHGVSPAHSADEQLAPLNLSKRRKSEDLARVGDVEDSQQHGRTVLSGLDTWPPPRPFFWHRPCKEEVETARLLNLAVGQQPSATITSAEAHLDLKSEHASAIHLVPQYASAAQPTHQQASAIHSIPQPISGPQLPSQQVAVIQHIPQPAAATKHTPQQVALSDTDSADEDECAS